MTLRSPKSLNEHIQKIRYISGYRYINESPKYTPLVDGIEEDDTLPTNVVEPITHNDSNVHEAGEENQMPNPAVPNPSGNTGTSAIAPAAPVGGDAAMAGNSPPTGEEPEGEKGIGEPNVDVQNADDNTMMSQPIPDAGIPPQPDKDKIQNDIIKTNINVMKQLNQKITDLETLVNNVNAEHERLQKEVEEVREPTNVEKLMSRKQDSHPYYYNLNDMWKGNWFQARRDEFQDGGMKQTEDGSYIADFDKLPTLSRESVKQSFDEY